MLRKWLATPYILWAIIFTIIPLAMILIYGVTIDDGGIRFSLENIMKAFDPIYFKALLRSIYYALISTIICLIIAYPLALILTEKRNAKVTVIFIFVLPMWMNFLLRTYAWLTILETNNGFLNTVLRFLHLPTIQIIGTPNAIILGMVYNFLPFMILPIYNVLSKIDPYVLEAAFDLGASKLTRFVKVILPLSIPGVISGITMVFMPAITTFVIPKLLGSGKINLIGNLIEQQFVQSYNWYFGASLSLVLMVIILISMGILNRVDPSREGGAL
ncbi:MAG: ABC transporter permease [Clostridia bacterium]|nr:ABC transporter permease [Clostridia bacterium]